MSLQRNTSSQSQAPGLLDSWLFARCSVHVMLCNAGSHSGLKFFWVLTKAHQSFGSWHVSCQKLGKMCCSALPRKSPKRMHWHCFSQYVCQLWLCRTWLGLFQSRAICMAMYIFSLLLANAGCLSLPMNQSCLPELLEITFDTILPGRQQNDQQ